YSLKGEGQHDRILGGASSSVATFAISSNTTHFMISNSSATLNSADRLDSWKEIANYLRRDVRTVQRWEKKEGLPVYRHQHDKLGSVYAFKAELDTWFTTRQQQVAEPAVAGAKDGKMKLAVLPFGNLNADPEQDYFSDGLTEEMIT